MKIQARPIVLDRVVIALRAIKRPVTVAELMFLAGLSRYTTGSLRLALETLRELGLVTREARSEPYIHGAALHVTRVYYGLIRPGDDRG